MKHAFFLISASIILVGAGCARPEAQTNPVPQPALRPVAVRPEVSELERTVNDIVDEAASSITTGSGTKIEFSAASSVGDIWWVMPDGENILVQNAMLRSTRISEENSRLDPKSKNWTRAYGTSTLSAIAAFDRVLASRGFAREEKGSSTSTEDESLYDFVHAYQKGKTICTFTIDGDFSETTDMSFQCSDDLQRYHDEQTPYLEALTDKNVVVTRVEQLSKDFAVLSVNLRRTGYLVFLKKIDGRYVQIFAGQEAPPCKVVDKYSIPKEIVDGCYDEQGKERK